MSQADVEAALLAEVDHLEALTNGGASPKTGDVLVGYDALCSTAAEAEADWKIEEAKALVQMASRTEAGTRGEAEYLRRARVLSIHAEKFRRYKVAGAVKESAKEALVTSRTRTDALRTISANVRAQT